MLLFELYKVLSKEVQVLIFDSSNEFLYYGLLNKLDIDIMQSRVTFLRPINKYEISILANSLNCSINITKR